MKITIRPIADPQHEIDLKHLLIAAIAYELWRLFQGNDTLNWIEAEWHLKRILARSRSETREPEEFILFDQPRQPIEAAPRQLKRAHEASRSRHHPGTHKAPTRLTEVASPNNTRLADGQAAEVASI